MTQVGTQQGTKSAETEAGGAESATKSAERVPSGSAAGSAPPAGRP